MQQFMTEFVNRVMIPQRTPEVEKLTIRGLAEKMGYYFPRVGRRYPDLDAIRVRLKRRERQPQRLRARLD
jgi:hypothetical protein